MAVLVNPTSPAISGEITQALQAAADRLRLRLHIERGSTDFDLDAVFARLARLPADGLVIASDAFFTSRVGHLAERSNQYGIPGVYWSREYVVAGGLLSYGTSYIEAYRQAGIYAGRILRGERPYEMPVQQASRIELYINLRAATAFGLFTVKPAPISVST